MAKTGKQIQGDIRRLLMESDLCDEISGEVYRNGLRPRDSRKEDAIVTFTTGLPDQIQTGVVTVNIFIPDIDPDDNGTWVEDGQRSEEIELLAQEWAESLTADLSGYKFSLQQTIYTESEPEIHQHFVVVRLKYEYFGEDGDQIAIAPEAAICVSLTDDDRSYFIEAGADGVVVVTSPAKKR